MKQFLCVFQTIVLCLGLAACGAGQSAPTETEVVLSEAAAEVVALIDSLGEVTLDSLSTIEKAEKAYKTLSEEDKATISNLQTLESARTAYADRLWESQLSGEWFWPDGAWLSSNAIGANIILEDGRTGSSRVLSPDGCNYEAITWSVEDGLLVITNGTDTASFQIVEEAGYLCLQDVDPASERFFLKDLFLQVDFDQVDVNDYLAWTMVSFSQLSETSDGEAFPITGQTLVPDNLLYDQGWMYFTQSSDFSLEYSFPDYKIYCCNIWPDGSNDADTQPIEAGTGTFHDSPFGPSGINLDTAAASAGNENNPNRIVMSNLTAEQLTFTNATGKIIYINSAYVKQVTTDESGLTRLLGLTYDSTQQYPVGTAFPTHQY